MKTNANKNLYFLQTGIFLFANFKETKFIEQVHIRERSIGTIKISFDMIVRFVIKMYLDALSSKSNLLLVLAFVRRR